MAGHDTKKRIVDAALELLADVPPTELTTRMLARRVGISQPALFRHFRSRDQIMLAAVELSRSELGSIAEHVLAGGGDATTRLTDLATGLLAHVERRPGLPRLLFVDAFPGAGPARDALRALVAMQRGLVAELVRHGQAQGAIDPSIEPSLAATALIGLLQGAVLQWQLDDRKGALARQAEALLSVWLEGVGTRGERVPHAAAREEPTGSARDSLRALDVTAILAGGEDPLDAIKGELAQAGPTGLLRVTAPFRPAPLISLMRGAGHHVEVTELGSGRHAVEIAGRAASPPLDLRELVPPEPLERMLVEVERLHSGESFLARLPRRPRLLLPHLAERGVTHEILALEDGTVLMRVARR